MQNNHYPTWCTWWFNCWFGKVLDVVSHPDGTVSTLLRVYNPDGDGQDDETDFQIWEFGRVLVSQEGHVFQKGNTITVESTDFGFLMWKGFVERYSFQDKYPDLPDDDDMFTQY